MKFSVLTLFPEFVSAIINFSIIKRALLKQKISINIIDFRQFSLDKNKRVDDYQFGGGPGMVIRLQPILDALKTIPQGYKVLVSPQGQLLNQKKVLDLKKHDHLIILCGHYEGFDERIINYIDEEISIGDYILSNGEIPALVLIDAITRTIDNVISKDSLASESFEQNLLDYAVYTKPVDYEGYKVPEVLLSGNHQKINEFRKNNQIEKTKAKRPDLYLKYIRGKKDEQ